MQKISFKIIFALVVIGLIFLVAQTTRKNRKLTGVITSLTEKMTDLESQIGGVSIFDFYKISENQKKELETLSKSQLKQDIFVYLELDKKKEGFFVEFGATDGISLSNSYMLEQNFGWKGILAEPDVAYQEKLKINRHGSKIETLCVWKDTGSKLTFNQTTIGGLSTVDEYSNHDAHASARKDGNKYDVYTISLIDLLKKYDAPQVIDYLSIDTEGSEFEILEAFFRDNNYYKIKIITCEHNYTPNRNKIYELLKNHGYQRKYQIVSKWDDFYVLSDE